MGLSKVATIFVLCWLGLCLGPLAPGATAQQSDVRAKAVLSSGLVKLGGEVQLRVEVENASTWKVVELPKLDGIEVIETGPPLQSSYAHRMNGRLYKRRTVSWTFILRPLRAGEFEIPPIKMEIDGELRSVPDASLPLKVKEDIKGAELGFMEIVQPPLRVVEGQPFTLDLRFGWADELQLANAGLYLPWWNSLPGTLDVRKLPSQINGVRKEISVNRQRKVTIEQLPRETRGDLDFEVYSLTRRLIASRPGKLQFPQSTFEFSELVARGRGFEPDKYREYYANLPGFEIEVVPVPEENRPFEWTGAVGSLEAKRRVDVRDVDAGGALELEVSWSGDANVEFFDTPDLSRLDEFSGFKVLGVTSEHDAVSRRATYDLVPLSSELTEIPPVPLWTFDPSAERFVKVETDSVPIRVRAVEGLDDLAGPAAEAEVFDIRDVHAEPSEAGQTPAPSGKFVLWLLAALPFLWLLVRAWVRRSGDPAAPAQKRRRKAPAQLSARLSKARTAEDQAIALAAFLGAHTQEADIAWLGRDPLEWAVGRNGSAPGEEALQELAALQRELDASTWASANSTVDPGRVRKVAQRLVQEGL